MNRAFSIKNVIGMGAVLGLALAMPAWAKAKSGGGGGTSTGCTAVNVNSTLNDQDTQQTPQAFQILSDGGGAYSTKSVSRTNYVTSEITSNCFWTLDTTSSTTRSIGLTLSFNLGTAPPPTDLAGPYLLYVHGRLVTHCTTNTNNTYDVGTMTAVGQTAICPINLGFYAPDGVWYNLAMNPYNYGGTSQVLITCGGASGGLCNQWTVVPDPGTAVTNNSTNQASAIGMLLKPSKVGQSGGTQLGEFEVSFSFLIQK